ncbi:ABC transporter permease [Aeromicrobium sp. CTD01-1L150]|uniref:ABC transporter permease n=1 Tax=Aeromicrobium sp. CTD01-1L150 TaxID=3341830 RepID=UPI0035BF40BD
MIAALTAEWRKLVTTRMWWIIALVMVAYLLFVTAVLAFSIAAPSGEQAAALPSGVEAASMVYSAANPIGYVFPLLIGSMVFTTEFRHQSVTASLLVEPRRGLLLGAKLVTGATLGLVYGVIAAASVVLAGAPVLTIIGDGAFLTDGAVWEVLLWSVVVFGGWSAIGVAFGGLVTNQVAAIVVILAFTQFVEPVARMVGSSIDALSGVAQFLPGAAADAVIGTSFFSSFGGGGGDLLPRWGGLLMLLAFVALFALLARVVTLRKDIA